MNRLWSCITQFPPSQDMWSWALFIYCRFSRIFALVQNIMSAIEPKKNLVSICDGFEWRAGVEGCAVFALCMAMHHHTHLSDHGHFLFPFFIFSDCKCRSGHGNDDLWTITKMSAAFWDWPIDLMCVSPSRCRLPWSFWPLTQIMMDYFFNLPGRALFLGWLVRPGLKGIFCFVWIKQNDAAWLIPTWSALLGAEDLHFHRLCKFFNPAHPPECPRSWRCFPSRRIRSGRRRDHGRRWTERGMRSLLTSWSFPPHVMLKRIERIHFWKPFRDQFSNVARMLVFPYMI